MAGLQVTAPAERQAWRLLPIAGVVVLVALLVGGGWWVTHPTRLPAVGSESGVQAEVGQPVLVGLSGYPSNGDVVLRDVTPRLVPGSSRATVRVVWCVGPRGGTPLGSARGKAESFCRETPQLSGQRLTFPEATTRFGHLVLEVVPLEPGEVTIDGADISYSAGLQRGTQASGVVVKVRTS